MYMNCLNHDSTRLGKSILPVLISCVILLMSFHACSLKTDEQASDEKTGEEAQQERLSTENAEIIGISDDKGSDVDEKKGYEYLQVNIKVNVNEQGIYFINSNLNDADRNFINMGNLNIGEGIDHVIMMHEVELSAGVNIVPVYFVGKEIRDMKANGPYIIEIVLCDKEAKILHEAEFSTSKYRFREFSSW